MVRELSFLHAKRHAVSRKEIREYAIQCLKRQLTPGLDLMHDSFIMASTPDSPDLELETVRVRELVESLRKVRKVLRFMDAVGLPSESECWPGTKDWHALDYIKCHRDHLRRYSDESSQGLLVKSFIDHHHAPVNAAWFDVECDVGLFIKNYKFLCNGDGPYYNRISRLVFAFSSDQLNNRGGRLRCIDDYRALWDVEKLIDDCMSVPLSQINRVASMNRRSAMEIGLLNPNLDNETRRFMRNFIYHPERSWNERHDAAQSVFDFLSNIRDALQEGNDSEWLKGTSKIFDPLFEKCMYMLPIDGLSDTSQMKLLSDAGQLIIAGDTRQLSSLLHGQELTFRPSMKR